MGLSCSRTSEALAASAPLAAFRVRARGGLRARILQQLDHPRLARGSCEAPLPRCPGLSAKRLHTRLVAAIALAAAVLVSTPTAHAGPVEKGIWLSLAEIAQLPTSGTAWTKLKSTADGSLGVPKISDQDSKHDVTTLAVALVYARTGDASYRKKAADGIMSAVGTEAGGRTLALGRNLVSYVVAADLVNLREYDAAKDGQFRGWLAAVRSETLDGKTLISTHESRPNNWGTHAGASRIAADAYLGDVADLARAAAVFRGWLGERSAYAGFKFGSLDWQADPANPVGINVPGARRSNFAVDGALPEEMRRGCSLQFPPCKTGYPWGALAGATAQAELLYRQGYDAWSWGGWALLRAVEFLRILDAQYGGWWASSDDSWQPWLVNFAYGTAYPAQVTGRAGKNMGWTDWTHARRR